MTKKQQLRFDWPAKAARVAELLPAGSLHHATLDWAKKCGKGGAWAVAFSGGADSLALLLLLRAHFPARRLVALHFNHRLRGRAAETDEKFCLGVCEALGVRCIAGRWKAAGGASGPTGGRSAAARAMADKKARPTTSEGEARLARLAFFKREMKQRKMKALWLAHQQDDIAETMLMRLARGSGASGLAAPRPVQPQAGGRVHLRPLLPLKKAELVAALRKAAAVWREDATNAGDDFFRNRVRRAVLPAWVKAAGRDAVAGAALARELLEDDDAALEAWLDEIEPLDRHGRLDLRKLAGKPRALVRRALHRWLLAVRPETDLSRQGFNQLLAAAGLGRDTRFSLGARGFAVARGGWLKFKNL